MLSINIPKPCHENWDEMAPTEKGAFCKVCVKDVVDFTTMTDDQVQNYLLNKVGEKTCGRFNVSQLNPIRISISEGIFYAKIAGWKKFMAAVIIAFSSTLFACNNPKPVVGKLVPVNNDSTCHKDTLQADTLNYPMVGEMVALPDSLEIKKDTLKKTK